MAAVTKEAVKREIDKVPVEKLNVLYKYIKDLSRVKPKKKNKESLMANLRKVKIEAPQDFSRNIDLYLNGEKTVE
jgi:CRISPR/Cas system CSM-associated protein Csm2 small subunit